MTTHTFELQAVSDEELVDATGGIFMGFALPALARGVGALAGQGVKEGAKLGAKGLALGAGYEGGKELVKLGTHEA
tara:strand:+ start:197 stop:424 length:228 start_codon:yes stop_codon:yes gene_type:complete